MSRFRHAVKDRDQHIQTLRIACAVLAFFLLFTCAGWMLAPSKLTVHNPPDLRTGSTRPWWDVPPPTVYSFAFYIFQQLNAWPKNGEVDYSAKINALSPYLTPSCQDFLKADAKKRGDAGELSQLMAVHRPRLFIAEAGNSFGLLADFFDSLGLTVNKISVKPGSGVSLPPFADAHKLVEEGLAAQAVDESDLPDIDTDDDGEDDKRDVLGEMEISARMMITGGDPKEEADLKRADRAMIREALLMAAHATYKEGRQMLPSDLQKALYDIASDNDEGVINVRNAQRKAKAAEMAESLGMFTQAGSFEAELFNREGEMWPEADVTLVDLGHLAREGYEAQMALTMVSMTNMINNIAESDQFLGRDIVFTVDEAHIVTVNPLLSPYMTKVVKMWRKLGAWLWLATQNLKDYPDIAEKMLNMAEWWICLTMPPEEVKDISRFRALTPEQESVLLSASKLSGCYTEGVVLAKRIEALFRAVPPSLFLALGMTEKEEKAERRALMNEFHCSELEAAKRVAQNLDRLRGLTEKQQEPATV